MHRLKAVPGSICMCASLRILKVGQFACMHDVTTRVPLHTPRPVMHIQVGIALDVPHSVFFSHCQW